MRWLVKPLLLGLMIALPIVLHYAFRAPAKPDHLTTAREALGRRDFPTARREIDAHLAARPNDRDAHLLAARTARRAGDGTAAAPHLERYLALGGEQRIADLERAMRRTEEGDVAKAGGVYQFCKDNPDHADTPLVLESLARGMTAAGAPEQAFACLDLWLARPLAPADRAQGLAWKGQVLERQGRAPEAAEEYRRALDTDAGNADARLRLAVFLTRDDPRAALDHFRRLDRDTPGRGDVALGMARAHRQLGEHEAAAALIARALGDRPDDAAALTEAGTLALDRGRPAEGEKLLRQALALAPDRRDANVQLLRCLQDQGRDADAAAQQARLKRIDAELQKKIDALTRKP